MAFDSSASVCVRAVKKIARHILLMDSILTIAVRGMEAASLRARAAATNIATAQAKSSPAEANLPAQIVSMTEAEIAFAANVAVYKSATRMFARLLDVIA
jgi:flagellar basal body rod protein FlgC